MKKDNIDLSYKILIQSCKLFAIRLVATIFSSFFNGFMQSLVAIPILISGIISIRGFYLAIKGSQYGNYNAKKRYFALFGNFMFAAIIIVLLATVLVDLKKYVF